VIENPFFKKTVLPMLPASAGATAASSASGQATITFLPEGRTLKLDELKYVLESWRQTSAFMGFPSAQLFHCNAFRRL
jgi:hypothetical protein